MPRTLRNFSSTAVVCKRIRDDLDGCRGRSTARSSSEDTNTAVGKFHNILVVQAVFIKYPKGQSQTFAIKQGNQAGINGCVVAELHVQPAAGRRWYMETFVQDGVRKRSPRALIEDRFASGCFRVHDVRCSGVQWQVIPPSWNTGN